MTSSLSLTELNLTNHYAVLKVDPSKADAHARGVWRLSGPSITVDNERT